jgi:hypothetical protein
MSNRGSNPVEWLRGVALSLERLAAQGVASGAVRGAADELRAGIPDDLDAQVRAVLQGGLAILGRLADEAARSGTSPLEAWSRAAAGGALRGAVEEARRLVPEMQPTTHELLARVRLWLERSASEAEARAQEIRAPGDRARIAAAGAIAGATERLAVALPALADPAADFASQVGRGFVRGAAEEVSRQVRLVARSPLARAVAAAGAVVAVLFAARGRRR